MAENLSTVQREVTQQNGAERTRSGAFFTPRVDIYETARGLLLFAEMPGVRSEDVDLRYDKGELVLHAKVQPRQRQGNALLREYEVGDFYRVFQIHETIDSTRIEASCKNGVLTVHLPKVEAAQPRQVKVQGE